jgi:hypothetical protein
VQSREIPHDKIVDEIVGALAGHLGLSGELSTATGGDCAP